MDIIAHLYSVRQKERRANLEKVFWRGFQVSFHIMSCWGIGVANRKHPLSEKAKEKTTSLLGSFFFCLLERVGARLGIIPRYPNGSLYGMRPASTSCFKFIRSIYDSREVDLEERLHTSIVVDHWCCKSLLASSNRLLGWWRGL